MHLPTVLDRLFLPMTSGRRPRRRLTPAVRPLEGRQLLSASAPPSCFGNHDPDRDVPEPQVASQYGHPGVPVLQLDDGNPDRGGPGSVGAGHPRRPAVGLDVARGLGRLHRQLQDSNQRGRICGQRLPVPRLQYSDTHNDHRHLPLHSEPPEPRSTEQPFPRLTRSQRAQPQPDERGTGSADGHSQ